MKQALWRDLPPNEVRVGGVSTNLAKNRLLESKCEACVLKHGFLFLCSFYRAAECGSALFGTGASRALVRPDAPVRPVGTNGRPDTPVRPSGPDGRPATLVRPVGTGAVPTLGTTRRDGGRPDASMGNFVPSSHYVTDKTGEASLTAFICRLRSPSRLGVTRLGT